MIKILKNIEKTVPCDSLSTLIISDNFEPSFLSLVVHRFFMMTSNDRNSSFEDAKDCEISGTVENPRKKENFRQRIRSLREECDDGPLLASAEDVTEIDNDSGFIIACRSKRGRRTKEFVPRDTTDFNLTSNTGTNESSTVTDAHVPQPTNSDHCLENILEFMKTRYPNMDLSELDILFRTADKQWANFKELSDLEMCERLSELKRRQNGYEDKNMEKLPSKSAWIEIKPSSESRVIDFNECTICLGAWDSDEKIKLEECGHCFHSECLQNWMKMKNTCPFCCTYSLSPNDFPKLT